jgi:hypothetical protein
MAALSVDGESVVKGLFGICTLFVVSDSVLLVRTLF